VEHKMHILHLEYACFDYASMRSFLIASMTGYVWLGIYDNKGLENASQTWDKLQQQIGLMEQSLHKCVTFNTHTQHVLFGNFWQVIERQKVPAFKRQLKSIRVTIKWQ